MRKCLWLLLLVIKMMIFLWILVIGYQNDEISMDRILVIGYQNDEISMVIGYQNDEISMDIGYWLSK